MIDTSLIKKINEITAKTPIFYITNDAERALGLEKLIDNYHIVCVDHNDMVDYMIKDGVKVFCLEKEMKEKNVIFRNSVKLLKHELVQKYIKENAPNGGYLMTFKISSAFKKEAEKLNFAVLNTEAGLNRKYENKLSQYDNLSQGVNFPETRISELGKLDFSVLVNEFGEEFVIQFDRGHTGSGTVFVNSDIEFEDLKSKFPNRTVRISKKIEGDPYTLNCLITKKGLIYSGLSFQLTGIDGLTDQVGGTVGNAFHYSSKLPDLTKEKIFDQAKRIAELMRKDGYLGLFGIDLIVHGDEVFIIEINARQPASVSFVNKLQILLEVTPMSLYHIAEFLNLDYELNVEEYNSKAKEPIEALQVFLRNIDKERFVVKGSVKTGIYRLQSDNTAIDWDSGITKENTIFLDEEKDRPLIYNGEAYSIEQAIDKGFLLLTQSEGKEVSTGNELARVQLFQTIMNNYDKSLDWIKEVLLTVKNYMK